MHSSLLEKARLFLQAHRKKKIWYRLTTGMAAVVVFITTYMLILPAITMERDATCGKEEHIHTEECYAKTESGKVLHCNAETLGLHRHTEACRGEDGSWICGQVDYVLHKHDALCYDADGKLVCELPEVELHEHSAACYDESGNLVCGLPEIREHKHSDSCYSSENLICGQIAHEPHTHGPECYSEEQVLVCGGGTAAADGEILISEGTADGAAHEHTADCYETRKVLTCLLAESPGHVHTDACYSGERKLICGMEEMEIPRHQHDESCFVDADAQGVLICGKEEHQHDASCYRDEEPEANANVVTEETDAKELTTEIPETEETKTETDAKELTTELPETEAKELAAELSKDKITEAPGESETAVNVGSAAESREAVTESSELETAVTSGSTETEVTLEGSNTETESISGSDAADTDTELPTESTETEADTGTEPVTESTEANTELTTESMESETETEPATESMGSDTEPETEPESDVMTEDVPENEETETSSETETGAETDDPEAETEETEEAEPAAAPYFGYVNDSSWCTVERSVTGLGAQTAAVRRVRQNVAARAAADGSGTGIDFSPYVTSAMIVKLVNGRWEECNEVMDGDQVRVQINYSLPSGKVDADNKVIYYHLPEGVYPNKIESGTVYNAGVAVGTYEIGTDGRIEITFNDTFATGESFRGTIYFEGSVSATGADGDNVIEFVGTGQTITVIKNTEKNDISVSKKGSVTQTMPDGSAKIQYEITASTRQGTDGAVKITDAFQDSSATGSFDKESLEIWKVDFTGQEAKLNTSDYSVIFSESDGKETFSIEDLPALFANEKYIVKYSANVTCKSSDGAGSIINMATAGYKNTTVWGWNSVEVSKSMIKKEGWYDQNRDLITWKITVNEAKKDISGYTVSDSLPEGLKIAGDVVLSGSDGQQITVLPVAGEGFTYTFPEGSSDMYTISFQTKAEKAGTVRNTAGLKPGEGSGDGYTAGTDVGVTHRDWNLQKWYIGDSKQGEKKIYSWRSEITLPYGEVGVEGFTYEDRIRAPEGGTADSHYAVAADLQSAIERSLELTMGDGTVKTYEQIKDMLSITYYDADGAEVAAQNTEAHVVKFQIHVKPAEAFVGRSLRFTYPTVVDYSGMKEGETWRFANEASIPDHTTEASKDYTMPKTFTKQGGVQADWGGMSYFEGSVSVDWDKTGGRLYYRLLLRTKPDQNGDLTVTDILPEGMKYADGTVRGTFYGNDYWEYTETNGYSFQDPGKVTVTQKALEDGRTELAISVKGGYNNGLSNGDDGRAIWIYYETSIEDDQTWEDMKQENKTYLNTAAWNGNTSSMSTEVERVVEKVSKTGVQLDADGKPLEGTENVSDIMEYTVVINPAGADLNPNGKTLTLRDVLSVGNDVDASLLLDQLRLYQYDAKAEGQRGALIERSQYQVSYDENRHQMTLTIPDKRACVLVYQYRFAGMENNAYVSNTILLEGRYSSKSDTKIETSSSGATVERAKVEIYKVDREDYGKLIDGALFQLEKREKGQNWSKVGNGTYATSGGKIVLNHVPEGDAEGTAYDVLEPDVLYRLTETQAPQGYARSEKAFYFLCRSTDNLGNVDTIDQVWGELGGETFFQYEGTQLLKEDIRFFRPSGGELYVPNDYAGVGVEKVWLDEKGSAVEGEVSAQVELYRSTRQVDPDDVVTVRAEYYNGGNLCSQKEYTIARGTDMVFWLNTSRNPSMEALTVTSENCKAELSVEGSYAQVKCAVSNIKGTQCTVRINDGWGAPGFSERWEGTEPGILTTDAVRVTDAGIENPVTLNKGNGWAYTWTNLPTRAEDGKDYYYLARELNPNPAYVVSYSDNDGIQKGEITVTNTRVTSEDELTIRKEWEDKGISAKHEEILVNLYKKAADGGSDELVETIPLNDENDWICHKTGLDPNAFYYVVEDAKTAAAGYTVTYSYDGQIYETAEKISASVGHAVTITNTRQLAEVQADKKWKTSAEKDAPDLTEDQLAALGLSDKIVSLHLYGTTSDIANAEDKTQFFEDGTVVVSEDGSTVSGVLKEAYREYDGGAVRVSKQNGWHAEWETLPVADEENGKPYYYYVVEEPDGEERAIYDAVFDGNGSEADTDQPHKITVRNILRETYITVNKSWFDVDGTELTAEEHPASVQVQLYRTTSPDTQLSQLDDTCKVPEMEPVELGSAHAGEEGYDATGWQYTWEHLAWKDSDGKVYYYYIKEIPDIANSLYIATIEGNGAVSGSMELRNTKCQTTNISMTKEWKDRDGNITGAPEDVSDVTVQLLRASIPGSFEENFAKVSVSIQGNNETLFVKKGSKLKIYLKNANGSGINSYPQDTIAINKVSASEYEAIIHGEGSISGWANGENGSSVVLKTEVETDIPADGWSSIGGLYTLNSSNSWYAAAELPREGSEDGGHVTYVYSIQEVGVPSGYTVSYTHNGGCYVGVGDNGGEATGSLTVTNTKNDTQIAVTKQWLDASGNLRQPDDCDEVQVELWRAEIPGSSQEQFADVAISLKKYSDLVFNEQYTVRKNSVLTLKLADVSSIQAGDKTISPVMTETVNNVSLYTYEIEASGNMTVAGNGGNSTAVQGISMTYSGADVPQQDVLIATQSLTKPENANDSPEWKTVFPDLAKEGIRDGQVVSYVYYVREKGSPIHYLTSYEGNDGIAGGTVLIKNKKAEAESTEVTVEKKWLDSSGAEMTPTVNHIDVNLYQAEVDPGITVKFHITDNGETLIQAGDIRTDSLIERSNLTFKLRYVKYYSGETPIDSLLGSNEELSKSGIVRGEINATDEYIDYYFTISDIQNSMKIDRKINQWNTASRWTLSVESAVKDDAPASLVKPILYQKLRLSAANDWTQRITDLPKSVTDNGDTIQYQYYVVEDPVPEGYESTVSPAVNEGTITVANRQKDTPKTTSITVKKQWLKSDGTEPGGNTNTGVTVTFDLMQRKLSGTEVVGEPAKYGSYEIQFDGGEMKKTVDKLPLTETVSGVTYTYQYYVVETQVNGADPNEKYLVSYTNNGGISEGEIVIHNQEKQSYTLPETGGPGTSLYMTGGLLLTAIASLLLCIEKMRRKEGQGTS